MNMHKGAPVEQDKNRDLSMKLPHCQYILRLLSPAERQTNSVNCSQNMLEFFGYF